MGPIKDIAALAHNLKKLDKQNETRKVDSKKDSDKIDKQTSIGAEKDRAEISDTGRSLLSVKIEAEKYLTLIENTNIVDDEEIEEIREKVMMNYYSKAEVIEKITEKLLDLPKYISTSEESEADNENYKNDI